MIRNFSLISRTACASPYSRLAASSPEVAPSLALTSLTGRNIAPGDRDVVVMERATAAVCGVALGGTLRIVKSVGGEPLELTVIGLYDTERIAEFQADILYVPLVDLPSRPAGPR